ncbi:MAG: hypothetical protein HYT37_04340 [Candidatus Sungbacteria bacterium]|nr:hypothetical protein [Candidatus Sungbacteria bacterium]
MEKIPKFIKEFSKENFSEERAAAAKNIREKREQYFQEQKLSRETKEKLKSIQNLEREINVLSSRFLGKLRNYLKLRKLNSDLAQDKKTYYKMSRDVNPEKTNQLKEYPERIVNNFYKTQKEKWVTSQYTKEDITKYFSEKHLSLLSLKDYELLLKRFPGALVAHVTRQGIRDHTGHMFHNAGVGEYTDGFMKIAKDGRLRSPLGVYLMEGEKEKAVARFLQLEKFKSKKDAYDFLKQFTEFRGQGEPGSFVDRMAVHFATQEVADTYYGSEKGNEIFIAYPSAYIASQYYFNGQLNESGGGYWNDQWVWANEEKGMDLNAGVVFIPEDALVDKKNGSRYALDQEKKPIMNQELIDKIKSIVAVQDFYDFAGKAEKILGHLNQDWTDEHIFRHNLKAREDLEPYRVRVEQDGIKDIRAQRAILSYSFLQDLRILKEYTDKGEVTTSKGSVDLIIATSLQKMGILYKEAEGTVSAKEFWETYFSDKPDKKPSKIVYYKSGDPTEALWKWKKGAGISRKTESKNLGFEEREVPRTDPHATAGLDRFRSIAEKVIEEYFNKDLNID